MNSSRVFMNEQEKFWMQSFGTDYIGRNKIEELLPANINFFTKISLGVQKFLRFGVRM